jgi:hypothetical protein
MKLNYLLVICLLVPVCMFSCTTPMSKAPILIIATNAGFGTYTGELLKAEGLNEFILDSLDSKAISKNYLKQFDVVILAECEIDKDKKELFEEYVKTGGKLIAFRPDKNISGIFGIEFLGETIDEGYIKMDENSEQGRGLIKESMQFHGIADKYSVQSAKIIASILFNKDVNETFPGIVANNYGEGQAIAFLYNLPKSIVYTRQGNPLFAGIEKDGIPGLRGIDLFTDGWVDTSKNTINQADQQMALLSTCIQTISNKPLPRFWYFPDTLRCLITLTNDGEFRSENDFEPQLHDVDSAGAKMSLYLLQPEKVSKEWVAKWTARGHEISGHPDDTKEAGHPKWENMDKALKTKTSEIATKFGLPTLTVVNHWFVWCGADANGKQDFGAQAKLEEKNGIELDVNYPHYDINSNQGDFYLGTPGINQGNFTGSGLTMKYVDVNGKTIDVYQHFNAVYDQQYNESQDPAGFFNCFKGLVDRSINNDIFSFVSIKSHNDEYYFSKVPLMKMLDYANSKGIPVWTVAKLLDFLKMKDEAFFSNVKWENNQLSFNLNSSLTHSNGLTFMVPSVFGGLNVNTITIDGVQDTFSVKTIKCNDFAFVTISGGLNYTINVKYRD